MRQGLDDFLTEPARITVMESRLDSKIASVMTSSTEHLLITTYPHCTMLMSAEQFGLTPWYRSYDMHMDHSLHRSLLSISYVVRTTVLESTLWPVSLVSLHLLWLELLLLTVSSLRIRLHHRDITFPESRCA